MLQLVRAVLGTFAEPFVLIIDFLELADVGGWADVVSALQRVLKPGTRVLFCSDGQFLRDYTALVAPARAEVVVVDEHTEYFGMVRLYRCGTHVIANAGFRMPSNS